MGDDNSSLQALMQGLGLGGMSKLALGGINPSAGNPRGAMPPVDPLVGQFRSVIAELNALAQGLQRQGDASRSLDVQEYSMKIMRMSIDRQNDLQKAGMPQTANSNSMPVPQLNINGGGGGTPQ